MLKSIQLTKIVPWKDESVVADEEETALRKKRASVSFIVGKSELL